MLITDYLGLTLPNPDLNQILETSVAIVSDYLAIKPVSKSEHRVRLLNPLDAKVALQSDGDTAQRLRLRYLLSKLL